ncbi:hypothetical protein ACNI65_13910 [Roseateles sp. So40a]|uniref:hypothetical protein n=1 Tax=Roseateles sp. So40a TaxID=3400226 RepID=UPI003A84DCFC
MSIRELTEAEIEMVSGGDAAATRTPGQDAWGESNFGGYAHYQQVLWDFWYSTHSVIDGAGRDTQCAQ